jgi:predicted O-linked N-acetylglucosamine transferase (SPINDLY family)
MPEETIQQTLDAAFRHQTAGELEEAHALYQRALEAQPDQPDILQRAAILAFQMDRREEAIDLALRSISLDGQRADFHYNLGLMLRNMGRLGESIEAFRQAIAINPDYPEAFNDVGIALASARRPEDAIECFRQALSLRSDFPEALNNLGSALGTIGKLNEAISACRQAVAIRGDFFPAYNNLGNALWVKGLLDEAMVACQTALHLRPNHAQAHSNLGNVFKEMGRPAEAVAGFRRAIEFNPNYVEAHSNLILAMQYDPGESAQSIIAELERFDEKHARPLRKSIAAHENDRDPDRRLRIGYVSADFREHVCAHFIDPLLRSHDHEQFEIFCYAQVERPDGRTARFQKMADGWRNTVAWPDAYMAEQIRQDKIDILIDLKLHTDANRLLTFAHQPAPVQLSWLGYPGSTGVQTIRYRFSDAQIESPESPPMPWEEAIKLPACFWCYDPLTTEPAVNELPALKSGRITFGCLNSFAKVNDRVLELWMRVLKATPGQLLLLAPAGSSRKRIYEICDRAGVNANRIEFVDRCGRAEYLKLYNQIDLGLDTFPYNGHTTSLDSLWMGVPMITMIGKTLVGRAAWSQLSNLDLKGFAARSEDEYVRLATILSGNLERLAEIRSGLRAKMQNSPLMNAAAFARGVETAYRDLWRRWCQEKS